MIACFDVHYTDTHATAASVLFEEWADPQSVREYVEQVAIGAEYQAGEFYRRELQPLLAVIGQIEEPIDTFVIDAYCTLSSEGAPGLGAHLHEALGGKAATIIGVAKNRFRATTHAVELHRRGSIRPLFVTALGMSAEDAAERIELMAGRHRLPTLIKAVDRLARDRCEWQSARR